MITRPLGRTGLQVSAVGIGTNQLRRVPEAQALRTLTRAFDLGVNLVNFEPDYEGADDLVLRALREWRDERHVILSVQLSGHPEEMERSFEALCAKFGPDRIDLLGITSISEAEIHGANVWGRGGLVDFLSRKKAEGRVRAIFASDHGAPHQTRALIERGVFDALLLAYNPLGFHIGTFRAETVYRFERPPPALPMRYEREDLGRTGAELLPLARERGVGIMIMKPLAGGLLSPARAFPSRAWREGLPLGPPAVDVLRLLLADPAVASVVPGMASVEEVEENARAGQDPHLGASSAAAVQERIDALAKVVCSRCGACDDLCSRRHPVSFLFRAAYHYLFPTVPFGISRTLQYFRLHAAEGAPCEGCEARTCRCPAGIDIPGELTAIHATMLRLRGEGIVPAAEPLEVDWSTGRPFSAKVLSRELPATIRGGDLVNGRVHVRNTGSNPWAMRERPDLGRVALAVSVDGRRPFLVGLRMDVPPQQECHFAFSFRAPRPAGAHALRASVVLARGRRVREEIGRAEHAFRTSEEEPADPRARRGLAARVRGLVRRLRGRAAPAAPASAAGAAWTSDTRPDHSARWIEHELQPPAPAGARVAVRVRVENTGRATWYRNPPDGHQVGLLLYVDGAVGAYAPLPVAAVAPGERVTFSLWPTLAGPTGRRTLRLDLVAKDLTYFSAAGVAPLVLSVDVLPAPEDGAGRLLAIASSRDPFFFTPSQGVQSGRDGFAYPLFAERAEGCRITDVEGREFVDVHMGWGCCLLGYSEPRVQEAVARAAGRSAGLLSLPHRLEVEVAEALCNRFPFGDQVIFGKNGSDVTTWAVRLARIATGRKTVLFAGYHGWQDWYVATQGFEATGVPPGNNAYNVLLPYRDLGALERALALHGKDVAAVMTDPAHTNIELDDPRHERDGPYLQAMEALARRAGALFVLDEIMTGFRFRGGSAQAAYGLAPDVTCLGKALANGMPLSALVARRELLREHGGRIFHAPTMKGELYSFAAAREALRIHAEEDVPAEVWRTGERIRAEVNGACRRLGIDAALIGAPYRMFLRFGDLPDELEVRDRTLLQQELTRNGVISYRGFVIVSRAHQGDAVDRCAAAFEAALRGVAEYRRRGRPVGALEIPDVIMERRTPSKLDDAGAARGPGSARG